AGSRAMPDTLRTALLRARPRYSSRESPWNCCGCVPIERDLTEARQSIVLMDQHSYHESRSGSRTNCPTFRRTPLRDRSTMAEGTIKKLTDKGFGFISIGGSKDLFFHSSSVNGATFA